MAEAVENPEAFAKAIKPGKPGKKDLLSLFTKHKIA